MPLRLRILTTAAARPDAGDATGPIAEREVELADGVREIRIGRRADVELPLPFAVLSGVHARLRRGDEGWTVEDLGSRNGTWLEGERLPPYDRRRLKPGAELRLASVRLRFEGEAPAAAAGLVEHTATIAARLVADLFAGAADGAPTLTVVRGAPALSLALVALDRPYVAGRAETCALALVVEEVSREHAAFVRDATGVIVRDLGSKNGVVVAGARVAGERRLADGDLVEVGPVAVRFDDPVTRYLGELERMAPDFAAPAPPLVETSAPGIGPPLPELAGVPPRRRGTSKLIVGIAIAVLLLLGAVFALFLVAARFGPSM